MFILKTSCDHWKGGIVLSDANSLAHIPLMKGRGMGWRVLIENAAPLKYFLQLPCCPY